MKAAKPKTRTPSKRIEAVAEITKSWNYVTGVLFSFGGRRDLERCLLLFVETLIHERRHDPHSREPLCEIGKALRARDKIQEKNTLFWNPTCLENINGHHCRPPWKCVRSHCDSVTQTYQWQAWDRAATPIGLQYLRGVCRKTAEASKYLHLVESESFLS